jgi:DNA polymerase-4
VAQRLCHEHLLGRVVVVKVKYSDFSIQSRRMTVVEPVGDTDSIFAIVRTLLGRFDLSRPIRLTGVSVADLRAETTAATLFGEPVGERRRRLEKVSAQIADRFGRDGIRRAALLEKD